MHQRKMITALASKAFMVCALLALACGPGLAQEAKTSKERLSGKGFDEQRVDNCPRSDGAARRHSSSGLFC